MLIYFDEAEKKKAIEQLRSILIPHGILFIGHADISFTPSGFEKIVSTDGHYFKKM